jgi:Tfp pilus assembly protein PilF
VKLPPLQLLLAICWLAAPLSIPAGDVSRYLPSPGLRPLNQERPVAPARNPDMVIEAEVPFPLAANGEEQVRNFVLPVDKLNHTEFVEAIQLTFSEPDAVTQAMIRADATMDSRTADAAEAGPGFEGHPHYSGVRRPSSLVAAWTPWSPLVSAAPNFWRLFPDNDLVVTCVLKPGAKAAQIRPKIALWFADKAPATYLVTMRLANEAIFIQPGSEDISVRDTFKLPVKANLLALYPDAGHAAQAFRLDVTGPTTEKGEPLAERLFDIPAWEAGQQEWYRFQEPVTLVAGTRIDLQIRYANPSAQPIRWGPKATDEHGEVYLLLSVENEPDLYDLMKMVSVHQLALAIEGAEAKGRDDLASHVQLAKLYSDFGETETAVAHGLKAVSLDGKSAEAYAALGAAYVTQDHDFAAQENLEKAIQLNPNLADAHYNLGNVFLRYGVLEKALAEYETAAKLDPRDPRFANNLGHLLMQRDRNKEAEEIFSRIVERNPFHAPATANLARLKHMAGDAAGAAALYRRAVTLAPAMGPTLQPLIISAEWAAKPK